MPKIKLSITASIIALVLIATVLTVTTFAAITTTQNLSSSGSVTTSANLGVYSNAGCTTPLTTINWGTITPGATITQTIYIKNTGNGLSLALSMGAASWTPAGANGQITLTWDQAGTRITPGQSVAATLTLTVSSSIADVTNFSVQINITGTN
jgi:uncharacterized protein YcnI